MGVSFRRRPLPCGEAVQRRNYLDERKLLQVCGNLVDIAPNFCPHLLRRLDSAVKEFRALGTLNPVSERKKTPRPCLQ
jgi:hypothetical protein